MMTELCETLAVNHPEEDIFIRQVTMIPHEGHLIIYEVGDADSKYHVANVVMGMIKWAHPIDYDVTRLAELTGSKPLGEILGATENVGSCDPGPMILWDKTQKTWHTDVPKVGRYSVRRMGKRMPFAAYLNGKQIAAEEHTNVEVVKRSVERRIREAHRINEVTKPGSPGPRLLQQLLPRVGNSQLNKR
jgi:hypothetical protein